MRTTLRSSQRTPGFGDYTVDKSALKAVDNDDLAIQLAAAYIAN